MSRVARLPGTGSSALLVEFALAFLSCGEVGFASGMGKTKGNLRLSWIAQSLDGYIKATETKPLFQLLRNEEGLVSSRQVGDNLVFGAVGIPVNNGVRRDNGLLCLLDIALANNL
jgi:hypothetical protein